MTVQVDERCLDDRRYAGRAGPGESIGQLGEAADPRRAPRRQNGYRSPWPVRAVVTGELRRWRRPPPAGPDSHALVDAGHDLDLLTIAAATARPDDGVALPRVMVTRPGRRRSAPCTATARATHDVFFAAIGRLLTTDRRCPVPGDALPVQGVMRVIRTIRGRSVRGCLVVGHTAR